MPEKFEFPLPLFGVQGGTFGQRVDIWKPIAFSKDDLESRGSRSYGVIGRLKPGVPLAQAQAEIDTIIATWLTQFPDNYTPADALRRLALSVAGTGRRRDADRSAHSARRGCGRVAHRVRESYHHVAGPRRCARAGVCHPRRARCGPAADCCDRCLRESVLLALIGGFAGALLAVWGLDLLRALGTQTVPRIAEANLDLRVLAGHAHGFGRHRNSLRARSRARERQSGIDRSVEGRRPRRDHAVCGAIGCAMPSSLRKWPWRWSF